MRELERRMPATEFDDWVLFAQEEPFGAGWQNWLAAMLMRLIAAINTPKNKRRPKLSDFIYKGPEARRIEREKNTMAVFDSLEKAATTVIDERKPNVANGRPGETSSNA